MRGSNYFRDLLPTPYTVLGLRLLPLSAGHIIRLNQVESPFLLGGQPTIEDLAISVLICAQNWHDGGESLLDPNLPKIAAKWQRRLAGQSGLKRFCKPRVIDWPGKFQLFFEYITDGITIPNYKFQDSKPRETNCPLVLRVMNELESKSNWTRAQLLDRPWKETVWDWLTFKVLGGAIDCFVSEDMANSIEEAKRQAIELAKQANPDAVTIPWPS